VGGRKRDGNYDKMDKLKGRKSNNEKWVEGDKCRN
jgi:hypothetical protein